jgi:hypothetical protein
LAVFGLFLLAVHNALRGRTAVNGLDFILVYDALGAVIWGFLLFKVFATEGLRVASGEKTELPRILIKYVVIAGLFFFWPLTAADRVFNAVVALTDMVFPNWDTLRDQFSVAMYRWSDYERAGGGTGGIISTIIGTVQNFTAGALLGTLGGLMLFLCYILIIISMVGSITVLMMNLVLGPVFFALAFDKDFRQIALHWFTAVLSYFLLIPLYGAAFSVAITVAGAAIPGYVIGLISPGTAYAQLLGPFIAVGIVFSVNKVVNALVGGAAGSGIATSFMGVAGLTVASLIPGGGMMRATANAAQQAARTVSNGGANSGPSATARAATGGKP